MDDCLPNKKQKLFSIWYFCLLFLNLIYFLIDATDLPYYKQFGTHLNKNAFLWNENPNFVLGMILGSIYYWGFF